MAIHVCSSCGARYSTDYARNWGRTRASDGMGTRPVCTALVPNPNAPVAEVREPGTRRVLRTETPRQRCGGELAFSASGTVIDDPNDALPIPVTVTG